MRLFGKIMIGLAVAVGLIAIVFTLQIGGLAWNRFFELRKENVKRQVFEETRSYNEGKIQQLAKYRLEYYQSDDINKKEAIKSTVNIMFANYNDEKLPKELKKFLTMCKGV